MKSFAVLLAASAVSLVRAQAFQAQSFAECDTSFSWMNNQERQSPCLAAAWLTQACLNNQYVLSSLRGTGDVYTAPNATKATPCLCSWSLYNLLQACTACQDVPVGAWAPWIAMCPADDLQNDTYFPSQFPFNTSIPYWATVDPTGWPSGTFNVALAQNISEEDQPDVTNASGPIAPPTGNPGSQGSSSSFPLAAVVGGVVGGVVGVFILVILGILIFRRRHRLSLPGPQRPTLPHTDGSYQSTVPLTQQMYTNGGHVMPISPLTSTTAVSASRFTIDPFVLPTPSPQPTGPPMEPERISLRSFDATTTTGGGGVAMTVQHRHQPSQESLLSAQPHGRKQSRDAPLSSPSPSAHERKFSKDSDTTGFSPTFAPSAYFTSAKGARFNPPPYMPSLDAGSTSGGSSTPPPVLDGEAPPAFVSTGKSGYPVEKRGGLPPQ